MNEDDNLAASVPSYDIITVGNAIIDAFLGIHDANVHCRINEQTSELCITCGEKIMLDNCSFQLGGNACNVAVGSSRLGFNVMVLAEIGDDEFANKIINILSEEKVDRSHMLQKKGMRSSFAIGIQFKGERTLFVDHVIREHNLSFDHMQTKWMYLTSLGAQWHHAYEQALSFVEMSHCQLAFNPGTPQLEEGYESIAAVMKQTSVFIVNKEEAQDLLKTSKETTIQELLLLLQQKGPKIVVITDGKNGTTVLDAAGTVYTIGIADCAVIEKTGAGDAFSTGFVSGLIGGKNISEALKLGTVNAASVIGKIGAQPGLLTQAGMDEMLKKYSQLDVMVIKKVS